MNCAPARPQALSAISSAAAAASAQGGGAAAAAAASSRFHVPWRDSKLTRLLFGNLGGAANTYLLATLGPAARDASETLSTLLFASRCMRVAAVPVAALAASQADFAELAARLQARLSSAEARHAAEVEALCSRYEAALADAAQELAAAQAALAEARQLGDGQGRGGDALATFSVSLFGGDDSAAAGSGGVALASPVRVLAAAADSSAATIGTPLWAALEASVAAVLLQVFRARKAGGAWARAIGLATAEEAARVAAEAAMAAHDAPPAALAELRATQPTGGSGLRYGSPAAALVAVHRLHPSNLAGRVAPTSATGRVGGSAGSPDVGDDEDSLAAAVREADSADAVEAEAASGAPRAAVSLVPVLPPGVRLGPLAAAVLAGRIDFGGAGAGGDGGSGAPGVPAAAALASLEDAIAAVVGAGRRGPPLIELAATASPLRGATAGSGGAPPRPDQVAAALAANLRLCDAAARIRDARWDDLKRHAASVEALLRARDEDAGNQRYVLRYLVDTAAALRAQVALLQQQQQQHPDDGDEDGAPMADPQPLARLMRRRETVSVVDMAPADSRPSQRPALISSSPAVSVPVVAPAPPAARGREALPVLKVALGTGAAALARPPTPTPPAEVGAAPALTARPVTTATATAGAPAPGRPPRAPSSVAPPASPRDLVPLALPTQSAMPAPRQPLPPSVRTGPALTGPPVPPPSEADSLGVSETPGSDEVECIVGRRLVGSHLLCEFYAVYRWQRRGEARLFLRRCR